VKPPLHLLNNLANAKKAEIARRRQRFAEKSRGRSLGQAKSGLGEPGPYYQAWNGQKLASLLCKAQEHRPFEAQGEPFEGLRASTSACATGEAPAIIARNWRVAEEAR
jgi:hypothetical protein